jgi:hypothetical protein
LTIMKALGAGKRRGPGPFPSSAQVEHERSMWGPHADPQQTAAEQLFYVPGLNFLSDLFSAVFGEKARPTFAKAEAPRPPGWGELAAHFGRLEAGSPAEQVSTWASIVDKVIDGLLPQETVDQIVKAWALRSHLLHQLGKEASALGRPGAWEAMFHLLPDPSKAQLEWTQLRGAQYVTQLSAKARAAVLESLVQNRLNGGNAQELRRDLFERFGTMNRDWRRTALTETSFAVQNGLLVTAADGEEWEAIWNAAPTACPFCQRMAGRVFKVLKPGEKGDPWTTIAAGRNNVGRSASPRTKDGRVRTPEELWIPSIPAHPNCMCGWILRRVAKTKAGKAAAALFRDKQAERYKEAVLAQTK